MSIYRDKARGRFVFEFSRRISGRRVRTRKLLPKTWNQAQADAFDRQESGRLYAIARNVEGHEHTIEEAVACYLTHHAPTLKHTANVELELAQMFWAYQARPLSGLSDACNTYALRARSKKGELLAPATIRNRIRYLTAACRYAWKHHGMGAHDPAEKVSVPTVRNERQQYVDRRGMLTLARATKHRQARMAIRIAFYSGMRLSEILRARTRVDCWVLDDTKNGSPRIVPIHPKVAVCARRFVPAPKITIQRCWQKARAKAGAAFAGLHFHDLRHSAASELINADVDLYTVGRILGHKDSRSTQRYAHLAVGRMAEAVNRIGRKAA